MEFSDEQKFFPETSRSITGLFRLLAAAVLVLLSACALGPIQTTSAPEGMAESPTPFVFPPTFTPTQPGPPTATNTPRPSATPVSTLTPGPTLAPSATPLINIVFASDENQPPISQNLLFFAQGSVRLWDRDSGLVAPLSADLPEDTFESYAAAGGMIALSRQVVPDSAEILVYSRLAGTVLGVLEIPTGGILDMELSPDGSWLAYVAAEYEPRPTDVPTHTPEPTFTPTTVGFIHPTPTPTPTFTPTPVFEVPTGGTVFVVRVDSLDNPEQLGECGRSCSGLFWSPGSASFVWGDQGGLWESGPGVAPNQILEPFLSGISGSTQSTDSYFPVSWSLSGRYLLVRKGLRQGVIYAVADLQTGMLENVPGTGVYSGPSAGYTWLPGDLFFITRPGVEAISLRPAGELWELAPGNPESIFVSRGEIAFPGDFYTLASNPRQLPDGRVGFSLINFRDQNDAVTNGAYLLDLVSGEILKINGMPFAQVEDMLWLEDGTGVLVQTASRILYLPAFSDEIYSLSNFLGRGSCCFDWID